MCILCKTFLTLTSEEVWEHRWRTKKQKVQIHLWSQNICKWCELTCTCASGASLPAPMQVVRAYLHWPRRPAIVRNSKLSATNQSHQDKSTELFQSCQYNRGLYSWTKLSVWRRSYVCSVSNEFQICPEALLISFLLIMYTCTCTQPNCWYMYMVRSTHKTAKCHRKQRTGCNRVYTSYVANDMFSGAVNVEIIRVR